MEKDFFPPSWTQTHPPMVNFPAAEMDINFYSTTTTSSNWDQSIDHHHNDPFESALSSMGSSPTAGGGSGVQLIELIGKLGSICSPHSFINNNNNQSASNSCYSTPMNSPPKLNLSMAEQIRGGGGRQLQIPALAPFAADPGFAERAARLSCFGSRSFNGRRRLQSAGGSRGQFPINDVEQMSGYHGIESGKLQRLGSCQFPGSQPLEGINQQIPKLLENNNGSDSKEESSISQQVPKLQSNETAAATTTGRKRKAAPRGKGKESQSFRGAVERIDLDSKRAKLEEDNESDKKQSKECSKLPEPPKDYIHVRARRGQATDSHSLAERVRREKISERMKFLQDLVPGCNKVTGKAVMLDEIINYVQSLQRQVEFLSMKLATVNPRMDSVHMEALLSKEILQSRAALYPVESSNSASAAFPYAYQSQDHSCLPNGATDSQFINNSLHNDQLRPNHHHHSLQLPSINGFCNSSSPVSMWEDELHNVVQMGFATGSMEPSQTKMEP